MNYIEAGYNNLLQKNLPTITEMTQDKASYTVSELGGSSISGGRTSSPDGKLVIDWDLGSIVISDGAFPRILIGYQSGGFQNA